MIAITSAQVARY